jgi:epoxyqueuosine reductase
MNATDYRAYFFGSAVTRCTHVMMLRNVAVALGNWGSAEAADMLERLARHESALVRAHAVWGLTQCASQNAVRYLREVHKSESDPLVLAEFSGPLEG